MAKERLSRLQKYIINKIYKNTSTSRKCIRAFFGKKAGGMFSRGETMTTAERVVIHRSVNSLLKRDIIKIGKHKDYYLTERGFSVFLKVNKSRDGETNVNFKDYEDRRDQSLKEYEAWLAPLKAFGGLNQRRKYNTDKDTACAGAQQDNEKKKSPNNPPLQNGGF